LFCENIFRNGAIAYEVFYSSNILSHEMGFFINQVQYYINFEILECSWAALVDKIDNANDLDELITAHLQFLDELANGCLLADKLWNNLKALRSIFDQIVRFEVSFFQLFFMLLYLLYVTFSKILTFILTFENEIFVKSKNLL